MAIKQCFCEHKYQDEKYGKHKRVHNKTAQLDKDNKRIYRCTVCKRERT